MNEVAPIKNLYLSEVQKKEARIVLRILKKGGPCLYGNVVKKLGVSEMKGIEVMLELITKGFIKHVGKTSKVTLNVDLYEDIEIS